MSRLTRESLVERTLTGEQQLGIQQVLDHRSVVVGNPLWKPEGLILSRNDGDIFVELTYIRPDDSIRRIELGYVTPEGKPFSIYEGLDAAFEASRLRRQFGFVRIKAPGSMNPQGESEFRLQQKGSFIYTD